MVTLCKCVRKPGVKLWAFSYADLSYVLGVSDKTIRRYMKDNLLDPTDLQSIIRCYNDMNKG